jgi:hypothetical protein
MSYEIEFFRCARSQPDGGAVWKHNGEFFNLDEATDFGLLTLGVEILSMNQMVFASTSTAC